MRTLYSVIGVRGCVCLIVCGLVGMSGWAAKAEDRSPAEAGPESGGLRARFVVAPAEGGQNGFAVSLELINVSDRPITLRTGWWRDSDAGGVKEFLEAATSIESHPAIEPWLGQVMAPHRESPQLEMVLKAGEVLTTSWRTEGRCLKNRVTDPLSVQNPEFALPGLYAVHASLVVHTDRGDVRLRSNEQLVSIGGSRAMPKHTYGQLNDVDAEAKTASLNLGAQHKVEKGDVFRIRTGMGEFWRLTITDVQPEMSSGTLEAEPLPAEFARANRHLPERRMAAVWTAKK